MHFIQKLHARHKFLILCWENLSFARRIISACEYHSVTNVTYSSLGNIKTSRTLNRSFTCTNLISVVNKYLYGLTRHPHFLLHNSCRKLCAQAQGQTPLNVDQYMKCSDENTKNELKDDMLITYDFISEEEENQLLNEIEPYLKRLRYESNHWDDVSVKISYVHFFHILSHMLTDESVKDKKSTEYHHAIMILITYFSLSQIAV